MKDRYLEATEAIESYGRRLDAIYRVHGREGLKEYSGADVCVLYWCVQNEVESLTAKIESGRAHESDLLLREQLAAQLKDLHADLSEKHDRMQALEREPEIER